MALIKQTSQEHLENWIPKTDLGKKVKNKEITNIDVILENGHKILEPEVVDLLLPNLDIELIETGRAKGKFGGGKASIWRQTQKATKEGNRMKFSTFVVIGNKEGYLGIGYGSAKETVPAREKAIRDAKLNIIKIKKGCGSWDCGCGETHSIPHKTTGKVGSSKMVLLPAPKGAGLSIQKKCKKLLEIAGIKDVYSDTFGQTRTKLNLYRACFAALKEISKLKVIEKVVEK